MMKVNKWTLGLAAVGLVTLPVVMQAEEKMSSVGTALSSTTISGYVDTSAQWNVNNTHGSDGAGNATGTPPRYAFNPASKGDGFNLNVVNLVIEKPLDAHDNWAAGYKIDMIYGPNAVAYNTSPSSNPSDFGLKQAYVAMRVPVLPNGVDVKLGTFDSILGYETFNSGSNPNFSRSWAYTMEPTQHTGMLLAYQITKEIGVAGGIANTWSAGINNRSWLATGSAAKSETDKTYMGAITLTAPESWGWVGGSTLYGAVVNGFANNIAATGYNDGLLSFYTGFTMNTPVKALKVGAAYDYVSNNDSLANTIPGNTRYAFNAASLYVSYQVTEKLSLHGRGEYVWSNLPSTAGFSSDMLAMTATVQYNLWANVISRLEFRWDHSLNDLPVFNNGQDNSYMVAANFVYKF